MEICASISDQRDGTDNGFGNDQSAFVDWAGAQRHKPAAAGDFRSSSHGGPRWSRIPPSELPGPCFGGIRNAGVWPVPPTNAS